MPLRQSATLEVMSDDLVVVFKGSLSEADVIHGLLEAAGIWSFLDNENIASTLPPITGAVGGQAGRVAVAAHDKERAEKVIAEAHDRA